MEQQRALNALEPYLALSKSATSPRAAADLVVQATSAPHTYVFAELLQTPQIQSLRSTTEQAPYLTLLEIFAWGTYEDYFSTANLPTLNDAQTLKLRLLSLLPLLTKSSNAATTTTSSDQLSYAYLQSHLHLPTPLALEKLLTKALSSGLITGHLDPLHRRVAVTSVAALRDLPPDSIGGMTSVLEEWEGRCDGTLAEIEACVMGIRDNARNRKEAQERCKMEFDEKVEAVEEAEGGRSGMYGGGGGGGGKGSAGLKGLVMGAGSKNGKRSAGDMGNGVGGEGAMEVDERGGRKIFARGR